MTEQLQIGNQTFTLTFEDRKQYLFAHVEGPEDSLDISLKIWQELSKHCRARGHKKLLVEEDLGTQLSEYEMFELASRIVSLGFGGIKVAFVDAETDHHADNLFGETVARNRGFNIRVFIDQKSAIEYLLPED